MPRLLLLGAGHAHLTLLRNIGSLHAKGIEVTVIGPGPRHDYSGMAPGMLAGTYTHRDISFPVQEMVTTRGGRFLEDRAVSIHGQRREVLLDSGRTVSYDVLSCNTGSTVPTDIVSGDAEDVFAVKPIENLHRARRRLLELLPRHKLRIAVIGGGPAGLEIAGGVHEMSRRVGGPAPDITLYAGHSLLSGYPLRVEALARRSLKRRGIAISEQGYASAVTSSEVVLEHGRRFAADVTFLAVGIRPHSLFHDSGLSTGPDGGLLVNEFLQCPEHPEIFGGGDCIHFEPLPLAKVGVHAVRQNPVLAHNLPAFLQGRPLEPFVAKPDYLLIFNLGNGRGIFWKKRLVFDSWPAFRIKDWIDRRFMRRFQQ